MNGAPGLSGTVVHFLAASGTSTSTISDCAAPTATVYLPARSHFQISLNGYNTEQDNGEFLYGVGAIFTPFNPNDAGVTNWTEDIYAPSTTVTELSGSVNPSQAYYALFSPDAGVTAVGYPLSFVPQFGSVGYPIIYPLYQGLVLDGTTTNAAYVSISGSYACPQSCSSGTCASVANGWITGSVITQPDGGT